MIRTTCDVCGYHTRVHPADGNPKFKICKICEDSDSLVFLNDDHARDLPTMKRILWLANHLSDRIDRLESRVRRYPTNAGAP